MGHLGKAQGNQGRGGPLERAQEWAFHPFTTETTSPYLLSFLGPRDIDPILGYPVCACVCVCVCVCKHELTIQHVSRWILW